MTQPSLFEPDETRPCTLCVSQARCRGVRMAVGPKVPHASGYNRALRCLACGRTGEESVRTDL